MRDLALNQLVDLTRPYPFVPILKAANAHARAGKWAEAVFSAEAALRHPKVRKMRNIYGALSVWCEQYGALTVSLAA